MNEMTVSVSGMKGEDCIQRIESALLSLNGIDRALADLNEETVTIVYDEDAVDPSAIMQTIEDAGYQPS
ncbi:MULTISPECIES: heavy-metal-associated domain-containing protein [Bacillaceae]|uniref:heavy-metal-associated domain-containing protein n=1 Tax=Bacillales TaxID=1385 RepID=UPI00188315FE|nr:MULTISPECIES: cation transporter [Bacillaceae]MBF0708049.1 heavy-metal-associated domain-containing protein [Pseudalkalibacillus hwajinpoensis]MDO6658446.1 cation transporter [Anaerobacillus sp. 1_MG-2023]